MQHRKIKFMVGAFLIVGAIAYLITTSISSTSKFFVTVDELTAGLDTYRGAGLKVKGTVVQGSITRNPDNFLDVAFQIEEKQSVLPVTYTGVTPDMFEDGREVVIEGTIGRDGVFHANTLLTSCPSKYEAEKEAGKSHPGDIPIDGKQKQPALESPKILTKKTAI
ncbi:exported hypothetical protein [Nitrospina gracilis 3/211]|uniref:Uncharacterized protein n=1 Tax=Nitrospina gracilis (strain 3/211) TaxID=1266370 RepID=M1YFZ4_NITG3|nr:MULTISPECIES: cytochrome c maturation protein CcmE [Nitrospina]MCF8722175.1 cytochrome c-type biogenesis protein CcmE [Nitrospina sp. Nb-3]CCQ89368.1 exported hypothetical protein [Nitrospina gracilis 3/211]